MYDHFSGVYEGVKMVPTTLPVSENTVLVDMKLCTKPHGFMWTSMASKSRASALRVNDNVFLAHRTNVIALVRLYMTSSAQI